MRFHLFDVIESGECDASEHYCKKEDICRLHRGIQTVLLPKEKRVVVLRYGLFRTSRSHTKRGGKCAWYFKIVCQPH